MSAPPPILVVLIAPPELHPLAGALRTMIERVAVREEVRVVERADATGGGLPEAEASFFVGLEAPRVPADARGIVMSLGLDVSGPDPSELAPHPTWLVPAEAFGRPLDGLVRVQRLGSLLAACLDLAGTPEGREALRTDALWTAPGRTFALAGTAHLSALALRRVLARALAARAGALLAEELATGEWEADDWELPAELTADQVMLALEAADSPDALEQRALVRAEALLGEVRDAVDGALATHGAAALRPLVLALRRLRARLDDATEPATPPPGPRPSDAAVIAAKARLAALPRPVPGGALLVAGWAAPSGALAGLALGGAADVPIPGSGHALFTAAGACVFLACAALARLAMRVSRRRRERQLEAAERDLAAALADLAQVQRRALAPAIVRPAHTWLRDELAREAARLAAVEARIVAAGRAQELAIAAPANADAEVDVAVDLTAARALLRPSPEPLLHAIRAELGGPWRDTLPNLGDFAGAALAQVTTTELAAPWESRSDVAHALEPALERALGSLDQTLARLVPRGRPVRRLALVPRALEAVRLPPCDARLRARTDAHLLVVWRPA